jgi:multidrug efflux pump subunit AcrA (membrane-fusion protein)
VTDVVVAIDSSVPIEEAPLLRTGMKAVIDEPDLGIDETGVVSQVAEQPGTNDVDGFHVYFEVTVDGAPPALVGASVRITVPIESTEGPVLSVPVSAVSLAADGSSRVQRSTDAGLEFVTVEPGLSAGGFVQVTPTDGALEPGDLVVVGFESGSSSGG